MANEPGDLRTLLDLGEREILRDVIPRFANGVGDDCALLRLPVGTLVASTDPVPPPAAASLGADHDPFWAGWLLVTINASDLAASGARPLGFLAAIECEASFRLSHFERLLEGVKAGCADAGLSYIGGNIREAKRFAAVGVALGLCHPYEPVTRRGASADDLVVSIGAGGIFWRDACRLLSGKAIADKAKSPVYKPRSQIRPMALLAEAGLIKAAMDNSDGLLPSLAELSEKNELGIKLELELLHVPDIVPEEDVDPARLWLGWGDWNVIAAVAPGDFSLVQDIAKSGGGTATKIGLFTSEHRDVRLHRRGRMADSPRLESERFARDSWMLIGIEEYVRLLKEAPLP